FAQLRLEAPLVARGGDRFVVRFYSPVTTIGGGRVLHPWAAKRVREEDAALLREMSAEEPAGRLRAVVAASRWEGVAASEAAVLTGLAPQAVVSAGLALRGDGAIEEVGSRWFSSAILAAAEAHILESFGEHHKRQPAAPGIPLEALRAAVPGSRTGALAQAVLARLDAAGRIVVRGGVAALADFTPALDSRAAAVSDRVLERLRTAGLAPPDVKELSREFGEDVLKVLKFLAQGGTVIPVTPNLYYDRAALAEARARIESFLATRALATPGDLKNILGVTRKHLIPILEWLDRQGITVRTPEGRKLRTREPSSR
ncbi:MAG: SelB C-terminal domain-containing protein, partial [Gemmatimonadetes bacterium]|nr:SelB C-terminal domain-containing protein [Gemmatimonadota bacterium]